MKESTLNLASFERTTDILFDAATRNQVRDCVLACLRPCGFLLECSDTRACVPVWVSAGMRAHTHMYMRANVFAREGGTRANALAPSRAHAHSPTSLASSTRTHAPLTSHAHAPAYPFSPLTQQRTAAPAHTHTHTHAHTLTLTHSILCLTNTAGLCGGGERLHSSWASQPHSVHIRTHAHARTLTRSFFA